MKILVDTKELARAVTHINRTEAEGVLVKAAAGNATVSGTDGAIALHFVLQEAEVEGEGECCISAKRLAEVLKLAKCHVIEIVYDALGVVFVKAGRAKYKITNVEHGPVIEFDATKDPATCSLPATTLYTLLDRVRSCMPAVPSIGRTYLDGVHLHCHDSGKLDAVATDGHRLALYCVVVDEESFAGVEITVPKAAIRVLMKLLEDCKGDVVVTHVEGKLRVAADGDTLTTTLLEGKFPDYARVIPDISDMLPTELDAVKLADAIEMVLTVADDARNVWLEPEGNEVTIYAEHSASGEVALPFLGEPPASFSVNGRYMLAALKHAGFTALLYSSGADRPIVVKSPLIDELVNVVMPTRATQVSRPVPTK